MQVRASIDIGSNSVLLLAASFFENDFSVLANESRVTGLGRGLDDTGEFCQEAMDETFNALSEYKNICEQHNIQSENIIITATEASRVAKNAASFFEKIKNELGLKISIISGEGEAYYSTAGVLFDKNISEAEIVIMDIGGASTELIKVSTSNRNINLSYSMPVGVVRMTNWREQGVEEQKLDNVLESFSKELNDSKTKLLYCVAGTMTSVANMLLGHKDFVESEVHGFRFDQERLVELKTRTDNYSSEDFLCEFPFLGKRSRTIKSGIYLALSILEELEVEQVYVSTYGLRYGTLLEGTIKDEYAWQ